MSADRGAAVVRRAGARGIPLAPGVGARLGEYLDVLAFWNRRVNLTAFDLTDADSPTSDEAIDRLVLEATEAAAMVLPAETTGVDIGSGGGSPAIPLMVCCPGLSLTLVEVRERKAAFLREALRRLDLPGRVEAVRAEELVLNQPVSLVTMRAVRADRGILESVERFLAPGGRFFWFGAPERSEVRAPWVELSRRGDLGVYGR